MEKGSELQICATRQAGRVEPLGTFAMEPGLEGTWTDQELPHEPVLAPVHDKLCRSTFAIPNTHQEKKAQCKLPHDSNILPEI